MRLLGGITALIGFCLSLSAQDGSRLSRVRLATQQPLVVAEVLEERGFDVLAIGGQAVDLAVNAMEWDRLTDLGYAAVLVDRGRPFAQIQKQRAMGGTVPAGYPTLAEIIDEMNTAAATFPQICRMVNLTQTYGQPQTFEGRDLFALKISDNVALGEDEPAFLMVSTHHAREIVTPVLALYAIEQLTTGYDTDPQIKDLVNANEIWIAPMWNPDGYQFVFDGDNLWRKNRTVFPDGIGTDLNRNYPFGWDAACGGSTSTTSLTYRGPSEASEVETQTMLAFSADRRFAKVLDYHSSGREVLWGYGTCFDHPFDDFWQDQAIALSDASGYFGDNRLPSASGEHYEWQWARYGNFSFLTETALQFQPPFAEAQAEAALVWPGTLWLLERPISLWGHVADQSTGLPLQAQIEIVGVDLLNGEMLESGGPFGRYQLFLPDGNYQIRFSAEGYASQTVSLVVSGGNGQMMDVFLGGFCPGDFGSDERVDLLDFTQVVNALGQVGGPEDLNGDDLVDLADVLLMTPLWGPCM